MTEQKSLTEALRENSAKRPAALAENEIQWDLVEGGIRPRRRVAVDCHGSVPGLDNPCYNKPVWVIEDYDGYYPTCLRHSGKVLNNLLVRYTRDAEVSLYFHAYKGE